MFPGSTPLCGRISAGGYIGELDLPHGITDLAAGNVLFIAATADNYLRAYNMSNGEKLWQGRLPAGGQATPMTYEVNGKQYVVISAGGHGSFGTKMGDYIVAYALPDDVK